MTKHSKIDPANAQAANRSTGKRLSLIERADQSFGLGRLSAPRAPAGLPEPHPRARVAPSRVEETRGPEGAAEAAPRVREGRAELCGPFQAIDRDRLREAGLIVPEDPVSGLLEEFRIVKREVLADARMGENAAARRILVCSPHVGEGKTFCAANLAIALAGERDVEVLLIDADVLKPSLTRRLGIECEAGLMDALADPALRPESLAVQTDIDGLFVMPAGPGGLRDAEQFASARMAQLLSRLTSGAPKRYLIFDTPPVLAASPAAELAAHCGQALLVVRAEQTSRAAIEDAQQLLSACPDLKLLLNAAKYSPSGRRFGSYGAAEEER